MEAVAQGMTDSIFNLDEFVVTGTRTPKLLKNTPIQTRLISADDIKRSDATCLQDILQQELPGVEFSYAMSQQVNMNFSGFAGQNVLILIDGQRLAGETMDNVDFSRLNLLNVERIEIIKGAASALYGSNATGGVINIITKEASRPWGGTLFLRGGVHGDRRYGLDFELKRGQVSNIFGVQFTSIDTYSVCDNPTDGCQYRNVFGYKTSDVKDRIIFSPTDKLKLSANLGYFFKERLYNVDMPDRYRDFTGGLKGEWNLRPKENIEVAYNFDQYDKSDYQRVRKLDIRDYSNVQHTTRFLYNRQLQNCGQLTAGGDFVRDYLTTYQFSDGAHCQYTCDAFLQYDCDVTDRFEVVGALRYDYFSDGNHSQLTPKIALRYRMGRLMLRGGYSGGFRAPTLKEKYMKYDMQGIFWIVGNKDLVAEKSSNFNASAEYVFRNYNFTVSANYSMVRDKLTNTPPFVAEDMNNESNRSYSEDVCAGLYRSAMGQVKYVNISRAQVFGLEASAHARWSCGLGARLSYSFTHEDVAAASASQYCPARPHSLNVKIDWSRQLSRLYGIDISLTGRFLSSVSYPTVNMNPPFDETLVSNPSYTMWKLQVSNKLFDHVMVNVAVDNLLDYKPKYFYFNTPTTTGINFVCGFSTYF